ncbi:hypothetical protein AGMMS49546_31770 [Spirochaetia bacterium]|nr:hypothetical protein AGMMS49546_31770 [Spirochaetia bacterium]
MKRLNKIGLILTIFLFMGVGAAFAGEKTGTVTMKTSSVDKKGRMDIKIYLDTSGNGITDTMLSFKIEDGKEHTVVLEGLEDLIQEGSRITFDDTNMQSPTGFYKLIIWHDLISIDGRLLIQLYPNPYWFPFAFAKSQS